MRPRLRIHGIYDLRTLELLLKEGIRDIVFDLRLKSFSFIQAYKIQELLEKHQQSFDSVTLHFSEEKDFVIKKIISDLLKAVPSIEPRLFLEFSDNCERNFYDSFGVFYYWHYDFKKEGREIIKSPLCKGVVWKDEVLDETFLMNFFSLNPEMLTSKKSFFIEGNLEENLKSHLEKMFDYSSNVSLSYVLTSHFEVCYRNMNLTKLKERISSLLNKGFQYENSSLQ